MNRRKIFSFLFGALMSAAIGDHFETSKIYFLVRPPGMTREEFEEYRQSLLGLPFAEG